jgi:Cytochrome P450
MEDDVYEGMFLPAGSLVLGNSWYRTLGNVINDYHLQLIRAILHDENIYKDPQTFNPERFLKDGELDPEIMSPELAVFGFGRRYEPHSCELNATFTHAALSKDVSWPILGGRFTIFEHRVYISDVRHREGYRRAWQADHSRGRVYNWAILVNLFLLLDRSISNAYIVLGISYSRPFPFKCSIKPRSQQASSLIDEASAVQS